MIYLDNAGTTKPLKEVCDLVKDLQENYYFNASSGYNLARKTKQLIENARLEIASRINAKPENILFTSCATEANNQIIRSNVDSNKLHEYIFSQGEHPSIYNVALDLKNSGHIVKFIPLKKDGTINQDKLFEAINKNTKFVSIMSVSNETGAINDIENIAKAIKEINKDIFVHSDFVQALGKIDINFKRLKVDAITISSHKINGLKGAGALVCKDLSKIKPFLIGGGQENNLRSGTENVDSICAFGLACKLIDLKNQDKIREMNNYIKTTLSQKLGEDIEFVSQENAIPNIISVIFKKMKSEVFVRYLDGFGIICSKGSACSTQKSGNRILSSMGYSNEMIVGNVRISLGVYNTKEEIVKAVDIIVEKYNELK
ncbi:MAG: cysteine desulfurase [Clostridia bacterium]|nr:cysteine desulfurase [Clostridia bacterium]